MKPFKQYGSTRLRAGMIGGFAAAAVAAAMQATPATAAGSIDNSAVARASHGGAAYVSVAAAQSVPLADPVLSIEVASSGVIDDGGDGTVDAGDMVRLTVTVTNKSNVTISGVLPGETGIAFDGVAGTGSFAAASPEGPVTLAPGASQDFTAAYTLAAEDIYRAAAAPDGVVATATVSASGPGDAPLSGDGAARMTIPADPALSIAKTATLKEENGNTGDGLAETGDTITYTYVVTNTGNVALTGVKIVDVHEGVEIDSSTVASGTEGPFDETATATDPLGRNADAGIDGIYDVLGAGGSVTFTFAHTVSQAEFDAQ
ncbi:MAG: hypothetical protein K8H74_03340 [Notoacmeibacter sp.]|nr:hypothetical protein [Notoacmeibacter sp.]